MWILHQNFPKSETFDKSDHGESWAREPISLLTLRWLAKTCPKEAILRNFYCNVVIFIYVYIHSVILLFRDIPKYSSKFSDLRQASIPWPLFGQNGQNGQNGQGVRAIKVFSHRDRHYWTRKDKSRHMLSILCIPCSFGRTLSGRL